MQVLAGNGTPVLERVMQWVGKGHWLYVAAVSRRFRAAYAAAHSSASCAAHHTHYSAIVSTVNTLLFAATVLPKWLEHGEALLYPGTLKPLGRAVGAFGPRAVVDCATGTQLKCEWGDVLVGAATTLRPNMLTTACEAMRHMLRTAAGEPGWDGASTVWPDWLGVGLCSVAAGEGHLGTVRWFFEHGDSAAFGVVTPRSTADTYKAFLAEEDWLYALMQRCMPHVDCASVLQSAVMGGDADIVRYLCGPQHGPARQRLIGYREVQLAALWGNIDAVKALLTADQVCYDLGHSPGQLLVVVAQPEFDPPVELFQGARQNSVGTWTVGTVTAMLEHARGSFNIVLVHWLTEQLEQLQRRGRVQ